jgi:long-chain acyl-CoA synthetase
LNTLLRPASQAVTFRSKNEKTIAIDPSPVHTLPTQTPEEKNFADLPTSAPSGFYRPILFRGPSNEKTTPANSSENKTAKSKPEGLLEMFQRHGLNPAVKDQKGFIVSKHFSPDQQETSLTYSQMWEGIRKMSRGLQREGVKSGDRIAMVEMNTPEFMMNYMAGLSLGATMVPINLLAMQDERTKTDKLMYMLDKPNVTKLMIGDDPAFKPLLNMTKIKKMQMVGFLLGPMLEREVTGKPARNFIERFIRKKLAASAKTPQGVKDLKTLLDKIPSKLKIITPQYRAKIANGKPIETAKMQLTPPKNQVADILYTSGTSGDPKGVLLSHGNLEFTVDSLSVVAKMFDKPDDRLLMALPLFHIFGKAIQMAVLKTHVPVVMIPSLRDAKFQMDNVIKTIEDYKITVFPSVPTILESFVKHLETHPEDVPKVQSLRNIISGGAALKSETFNKLQGFIPHLKIMEGYGSSEGGINSLNLKGIQGFVGQSLPGVDIQITEMDPDTGAGEMVIKSDGTALGYLKGTASEEDQKLFAGGVFRTGDVARYDATQQMFQIVGRNSDVIKVAGERRPAEEFEKSLKETGLVSDAMAIAYKPDRESEKAVLVAITSKENVTEQTLKDAMSEMANKKTIPGWTIPKHIVVLKRQELPHGFIGFKRQYAATRDFLKKALAEGVVKFKDQPDGKGKILSSTDIPDLAKLEAFAEAYRYNPAPKNPAILDKKEA